MAKNKKPAILQGSLDLLVLQSLRQGKKMHGYSISRHVKSVSNDFLQIEEGSLYPALHRMERKGWIASSWGTSESNRRAKFYQLTPDGKKQLKAETKAWEKMSEAIDLVVNYQFSQ